MTDAHLLHQFVQAGDQDAFGQIVDRHIDMVYSAAVRQISDPALAEDVSQAVFMVLARKAKKVNGATLAGWLVNTARLIAMDARRNEIRRKVREQKAAAMKPESYTPQEWDQIGPLLDEALSKLREKDRAVVTLRYLEGRAIPEVAVAMGITEAAVAKRLTRSLIKLRNRFARKGVQLPIDIVATAFLAAPHLSAPTHLAGQSLSAALSHGVAVAGATAAAGLAHAAIASMKTAAIVTWTAVATAVAVSTSVVGFEAVRYSRHVPPPAPIPQVYVAAAPASTGPIRVGIVVSEFTATGPHYTPQANGDGHLDMHRALRKENVKGKAAVFELIPVIEPGSEQSADVQAILGSTFKNEVPVDGSNVAELMDLDVIVCPRVWDETPAVLSALESAVRQGKGLLNCAGIGQMFPGPGPQNPQIDELNGVTNGLYAGYPQPVQCEVITNHPLLGSLSKGDLVSIAANGESGRLSPGTIGLIQVKNPTHVQLVPIEIAQAQVMQNSTTITTKQGLPARLAVVPTTAPDTPLLFMAATTLPADYTFYPLSITTLGKGTILNCNFPSWQMAPKDLDNATNQKFFIRCVKWLAGRPLE